MSKPDAVAQLIERMPRYNDDYRILWDAHEERIWSWTLIRHHKIWMTRIRGENRMKRETVRMMASWALTLAVSMSAAPNAQTQDAKIRIRACLRLKSI